MMPIKLSLCIATLNRGAFIGQTLESIISQATDEVEIVIVDGASSDNTPEVVASFAARFPRLNYIRLPQKGGVDRDYDRTVVAAQGEYCWLMSDDDLLKPGAIQDVLAALQHDYSLIVVNAEVRSQDLASLVEATRLPHKADQVYAPHEIEQLMADAAAYMTFIGSIVIKRGVWLAREREKYYGYEFIHIGVVFQAPLPTAALVIATPWISIRGGNASWSSRYFRIWMFKWPELIWSFAGYSDATKQRVVPPVPWRIRKVLLISRARGSYSWQEYQTLLKPKLATRHERLMAGIIARLPGCLVNLPVYVYFSLFRREQAYGISELRDSPFFYRNCLCRLFGRNSNR